MTMISGNTVSEQHMVLGKQVKLQSFSFLIIFSLQGKFWMKFQINVPASRHNYWLLHITYYFIDLRTIKSPYSKFGLKWMAQSCEPQQWSKKMRSVFDVDYANHC